MLMLERSTLFVARIGKSPKSVVQPLKNMKEAEANAAAVDRVLEYLRIGCVLLLEEEANEMGARRKKYFSWQYFWFWELIEEKKDFFRCGVWDGLRSFSRI